MEITECELCGKRKKTATTTFNGSYCISCYRNVISECERAIREIQGKPNEADIVMKNRDLALEELFDSIDKNSEPIDTSKFFNQDKT